MRRRLLAIILFVLWIILIIFMMVRHVQHTPKQVDLYKATPSGSNIRFPYLAGPHTIDFFTGSSFAAYNTLDQTTKTISPQFILPTVSQVRWSKTGILFLASDYQPYDDLGATLAKKGLSTSTNYWWLYNFASKKLNVVLPANPLDNVEDAFWNNSGGNYCIVSSNGTLYLSNELNRGLGIFGSDAKIKQFNGNTITLTDGDTIKRVDVNTRVYKTLAKADFQDSYVSPDGNTIAYVLDTHPNSNGVLPGDLYRVDPYTGKKSKLVSDFNGAMSGSGGNIYAAYADNEGATHLELFPKDGKAIEYTLNGALAGGNTISYILPAGLERVYIVTGSNDLIQVTNRDRDVTTPVSYRYKIQTDLYEKGFEIHYDPYKNTYEIDITNNPFLNYQAAALKYIDSQGVDHNQIDIIWRGYDGVDTTNPSIDSAPVHATAPGE